MSAVEDLIPGVTQAKAIIGGAVLLALALLLAWALRLDHLRHDARQAQEITAAKLQAESNAHKVTLASLSTANATLAAKSAESDARAKALSDSTATYQSTLAALKRQNTAKDDRIAYWSGMADKYQRDNRCPVSSELAKELSR